MSLLLIEGPAGSGKSQLLDEMLAGNEVDVISDLTAFWVALRAIKRLPDGKYPVRTADDPAIRAGIAAYLRATAVHKSLSAGLRVAVTTGTPDTLGKWQQVAASHNTSFAVQTVDPGRAEVTRRLADSNGNLSQECSQAISRWYG